MQTQKNLVSEFQNLIYTHALFPLVHEVIAALHGLKPQGHQSLGDFGGAYPIAAKPNYKIGFQRILQALFI